MQLLGPTWPLTGTCQLNPVLGTVPKTLRCADSSTLFRPADQQSTAVTRRVTRRALLLQAGRVAERATVQRAGTGAAAVAPGCSLRKSEGRKGRGPQTGLEVWGGRKSNTGVV